MSETSGINKESILTGQYFSKPTCEQIIDHQYFFLPNTHHLFWFLFSKKVLGASVPLLTNYRHLGLLGGAQTNIDKHNGVARLNIPDTMNNKNI